MKRLILISLIAVLALSFSAAVAAQEATSAQATESTEQISTQDLGISNPTLLPNSPFYFVKEWARSIRLGFTFNNVKKAELENKFSNEKLVELQKMNENGVTPEKMNKAVESYQKTVEAVKNIVDKIKDNAGNNDQVNKFLDKFTNQQVLQEKILQKLSTQVPQEVAGKIQEAREAHLEKFQQVMTKLETNQTKIVEKLKNALQNGDTTNADVLEKIKEKMPEAIQQKLEGIRATIVGNVIDKVEQRNETNNCPAISKPAPDFCQQGKIKVEKDDKGCITQINCVTGSTSEMSCKELWWLDKNNSVCQQKKFCGAYMYFGLQTFETQEECQKNQGSVEYHCRVGCTGAAISSNMTDFCEKKTSQAACLNPDNSEYKNICIWVINNFHCPVLP